MLPWRHQFFEGDRQIETRQSILWWLILLIFCRIPPASPCTARWPSWRTSSTSSTTSTWSWRVVRGSTRARRGPIGRWAGFKVSSDSLLSSPFFGPVFRNVAASVRVQTSWLIFGGCNTPVDCQYISTFVVWRYGNTVIWSETSTPRFEEGCLRALFYTRPPTTPYLFRRGLVIEEKLRKPPGKV